MLDWMWGVIELAPYQRDASLFLSQRRGALLLDAQGVGKSYPAIDAAVRVAGYVPAPAGLIVCPAYLRDQWSLYLVEMGAPEDSVRVVAGPPKKKRWALAAETGWVVVSYGTLARYNELIRKTWGPIIFDEMHAVRGRKAKRSAIAWRLAGSHKWGLTGTPIKGSGGDMYSLLRTIGALSHKSYWRFVQRWCRTHWTPYGIQIGGLHDEGTFMRSFGSYILRRTLEDVGLDLPWTEEIIRVRLPVATQKTHDRARREYILTHPQLDRPVSITASGQLLPLLRGLTASPPGGANPKLDALMGLLKEEMKGESVIVWCWYKATARMLASVVGDYCNVYCITGDQTPKKRGEVATTFLRDTGSVLVATIESAREGLNLQAAAHQVFYEESYLDADNAQAIGRSRRRGQSRTVHVRRIRCARTIDEAVGRAAARRGEQSLGTVLQELEKIQIFS